MEHKVDSGMMDVLWDAVCNFNSCTFFEGLRLGKRISENNQNYSQIFGLKLEVQNFEWEKAFQSSCMKKSHNLDSK